MAAAAGGAGSYCHCCASSCSSSCLLLARRCLLVASRYDEYHTSVCPKFTMPLPVVSAALQQQQRQGRGQHQDTSSVSNVRGRLQHLSGWYPGGGVQCTRVSHTILLT